MTDEELYTLDRAVAAVEGVELCTCHELVNPHTIGVSSSRSYVPTRDPARAMALLEKHALSVVPVISSPSTASPARAWAAEWPGKPSTQFPEFGATPCIAICRAVVAFKGAK